MSKIIIISLIINLLIQKGQLAICNYYPYYYSGSITSSSYNCGSRYCCGSACPTTTSLACCSTNNGPNYCYSAISTTTSSSTDTTIAGWLIAVIAISVSFPICVAISIISYCCHNAKKRRVTQSIIKPVITVPGQTVLISPKSNNQNVYAPDQPYTTVNVPLQNIYNQPPNYNYPPVYNVPVNQSNNNVEPMPVYPNSVY